LNLISTPFVTRDQSFAEIARFLDAANAELATAVTQGDNFGFALSSSFTDFNKPSTFAKFNRALRARGHLSKRLDRGVNRIEQFIHQQSFDNIFGFTAARALLRKNFLIK